MEDEGKLEGELIIFRTEDGTDELQLRMVDGSVWLTQAEIPTLFDTTKKNVSLHLRTIFSDDELSEGAVVKQSLTTAADSKRYKTNQPPHPWTERRDEQAHTEHIQPIGYQVFGGQGVRRNRGC